MDYYRMYSRVVYIHYCTHIAVKISIRIYAHESYRNYKNKTMICANFISFASYRADVGESSLSVPALAITTVITFPKGLVPVPRSEFLMR